MYSFDEGYIIQFKYELKFFILIFLIYLASLKGHLEIVRCRCNNNADVNLQNLDGNTALYYGLLFNLNLNKNSLF